MPDGIASSLKEGALSCSGQLTGCTKSWQSILAVMASM